METTNRLRHILTQTPTLRGRNKKWAFLEYQYSVNRHFPKDETKSFYELACEKLQYFQLYVPILPVFPATLPVSINICKELLKLL